MKVIGYIEGLHSLAPDISGGEVVYNYSFNHPRIIHRDFISNYEKHLSENDTIISCTDTIFNIIYVMISEGKINAEDIKFYMVDELGKIIESHIEKKDDELIVVNYPYGFFNWN